MRRVADITSRDIAGAAVGRSGSRIMQLVYERKIRRYTLPYGETGVSMSEVKRWYAMPKSEQIKLSLKIRRRDWIAMDLLDFHPPTEEVPDEWASEASEASEAPAVQTPAPASILSPTGPSTLTVARTPDPFAGLVEARESFACTASTDEMVIDDEGIKATLWCFLSAVAPNNLSGLGYFCGFLGWSLTEVSFAFTTADYRTAKLAWADGLWDRAQGQPYGASQGGTP